MENTVELNTPSDVEKDFSYFVDGDRIDACDVIECMLESKEEIDVEIYYPRLACLIFVVNTPCSFQYIELQAPVPEIDK